MDCRCQLVQPLSDKWSGSSKEMWPLGDHVANRTEPRPKPSHLTRSQFIKKHTNTILTQSRSILTNLKLKTKAFMPRFDLSYSGEFWESLKVTSSVGSGKDPLSFLCSCTVTKVFPLPTRRILQKANLKLRLIRKALLTDLHGKTQRPFRHVISFKTMAHGVFHYLLHLVCEFGGQVYSGNYQRSPSTAENQIHVSDWKSCRLPTMLPPVKTPAGL